MAGFFNRWRYKIATYPDRNQKKSKALEKLVTAAKEHGIPTVFWNREDGVHFDRFIDSAKLFDAVLTVDETMLPNYKKCLPEGIRVDILKFPVQPVIHYLTNQTAHNRGSFVGSYSLVHPERKKWQDMVFSAAEPLGLDVYDRNSNRSNSQYRFPDYDWIKVMPAISYTKTADIYRAHCVNLNVNTITNSKTAYSRRLVEIMAGGTLAVTNNTVAVQTLFKDFCVPINTKAEAEDFFARIAKDGLSRQEQEIAKAASDHVLKNYTWESKLEKIVSIAKK